MIQESNTVHQTPTPPSTWQMPIVPEAYMQQNSQLTDEEKGLMNTYVTTHFQGRGAQPVLARLTRFDKPLVDMVALNAERKWSLVNARKHLFTYMGQTGIAFWAWSKETWVEVIESAPEGRNGTGMRGWMIDFAYLFCDFLYVGANMPCSRMADMIFGKTTVEEQVNKLHAPLVSAGYSGRSRRRRRFRWLCALTMLVNRSPYAETFTAQSIVTVNKVLCTVPSIGSRKAGQYILPLQSSLCSLEILDAPVVLEMKNEKRVALWENDPSVDPLWSAWVCAFHDQTPRLHERTARQICYCLLTAGRWLRKHHPEITQPAQWNEPLALEYVSYTCQALRGDQALPSHMRYAKYQDTPQLLSSGGIHSRLHAMKIFFYHVQRDTDPYD